MTDNNLLTVVLSLVGFVLGYAAAKLRYKENAKPVIKDTRVTLVHQIPPHLGGYSLKYHHATNLYEDDLPCSTYAQTYWGANTYYAELVSNSRDSTIRHAASQFCKALSLFEPKLK